MTDLRTYIGSATEVDLGDGTYELGGDPFVLSGQEITANGAIIHWTPNQERWCPALILRGKGTKLTGTAYLRGPAPMGSPYLPDVEAQHGCEVQGALDAFIGNWQFRNTFGDGIYVGKSHDGEDWTRNLTIDGARTKENGRCGVSLMAVEGADIGNMEMQRSNFSMFDVEPPGHDWGARFVLIHDIVVKDHGGDYVFACKGVGKPDTVFCIAMKNVYCPNRDFNAIIQPPDDVRRSGFTFINCVGDESSTHPVFNIARCDHVRIKGPFQKTSADLVKQADCTDVQVV